MECPLTKIMETKIKGISLNPCSNGMPSDALRHRLMLKKSRLNPCSNGMPSDMTVEAYKKEVERLNPCSNGMPSDLLNKPFICDEDYVLILVLMECPLTIIISSSDNVKFLS